MAGKSTKTEGTELSVVVEQIPGVIKVNYEQLKATLTNKLAYYKGIAYTEDNIKEAKEDRVTLNKLFKEIDDKRKDIKTECMKPYNEVEPLLKELAGMVKEPIAEIDKGLDEYETKRREEAKKEIIEFMRETFKDLPEIIGKKLEFDTFDTKWTNVSTSKRTWKEAIEAAHERVSSELVYFEELEEQYKEPALKAYEEKLSIQDAYRKIDELKRFEAEAIEREKARLEAEAKRAAEEAARKAAREEAEKARREAEEKARKEAEERTKMAAAAPTACQPAQPVEVWQEESPETGMPEITRQSPQEALEEVEANNYTPTTVKLGKTSSGEATGIYMIRVKATDKQMKMIKGYIEHVGAIYREVR